MFLWFHVFICLSTIQYEYEYEHEYECEHKYEYDYEYKIDAMNEK